jgi:hypothetical protein
MIFISRLGVCVWGKEKSGDGVSLYNGQFDTLDYVRYFVIRVKVNSLRKDSVRSNLFASF